MTPELLAHLTPEQQEAWERCQKATPGPWHHAGDCVRDEHDLDLMDSVLQMQWKRSHDDIWTEEDVACGWKERPAQERIRNAAFAALARLGYPAALLELAQTKQALAGLRAAVEREQHAVGCGYRFAAVVNGVEARGFCDCWKSRLPK